MSDTVRKLIGRDTDDRQALNFAQKVAALLKSRVAANGKIVLGLPFCPFKVALHTKEFHCFLFLSDVSYCFTAKPRPSTPYIEDFRVCFKEPDRMSGPRVLVPAISEQIGVSIYSLPRRPDDALEVAFASPPLLANLRRIRLDRLRQFEFSPVRLEAIASSDTPEICVEQALAFRDLLALANREAYERNKHLFE